MESLIVVADTFLTTAPWLLGLAVVFGVLARWMPCNPGMFWGRDLRSAATDLLYWLIAPLVVRVSKTWMLAAGIALLFPGQEPGLAVVTGLPFWLQCVLILVLQDFCLYWIHRLFHTRPGWAFHAVHHSPRLLDWASAARIHAVNHVLSFVLVDVLVLLIGFRVEALIALAPFEMAYSAMVHANLNWSFGPFRYVFASPVFHRWHHVSEGDAIDKNFASTFPVLDLVFGTFYMPEAALPENFGNGDPDFPDDFWGQLIRPFAKTKTAMPLPRTGLSAASEISPRTTP